MPTKTGRNDPCPCGGGKKYKRCCLENDQAAEHAQFARAAAEVAEAAASRQKERTAAAEAMQEERDLAHASNAVIHLVRAGKLDEAEQAARDLLVRYPEVHDGYDRLGMVYEARGDHKQAADCYRKVLEFIHPHSDDYDPQFEAVFHRLIAKLDPPAAT
jgi:tetratricopeptide (TPR) repeat protein